LQIKDILTENKIQFNKNLNEKYEKDVLSIRRLIRLLRFQIQSFIVKNNRPSYLWNKYSDRNVEMIHICFPGGEHIAETKEEAWYLIKVYHSIDGLLKTKFVQRIERVFIARRILEPSELRSK